MNGSTTAKERIREVQRIFDEQGFGGAELLEGWDGREVDALAASLTEEEFQRLVDELRAGEEEPPPG